MKIVIGDKIILQNMRSFPANDKLCGKQVTISGFEHDYVIIKSSIGEFKIQRLLFNFQRELKYDEIEEEPIKPKRTYNKKKV